MNDIRETSRFEERLLSELTQLVAERPAAPEHFRHSTARPRRKIAWGVAGVGTATAAVALPLAVGGGGTPAYSVMTQQDGTVRVEIRQLTDAEGLETELEAAGIPAEVDYLPGWQQCRQPRGQESSQRGDGPTGPFPSTLSPEIVFTVDTDYFRDGETFVIDSTTRGSGDFLMTGVRTQVITGDVLPCEPVDAAGPLPAD